MSGVTGPRRNRVPIYITIGLITVLWVVPTLGLLVSSFREPSSIRRSGWWKTLASPFESGAWTLENYRTVLDDGFRDAFMNTLAVSIPSTIIPITIAAFAAYAFAWMDFPGRNVLFVAVVGLMVVPLQMALIPILRLYTGGANWFGVPVLPDLDLTGTFPGVWLAHAGFGMPLAVYLLRNYMGSLPSSMIESAKIDGASHFEIFTRLMVPLSVPVLASFAIFQFLWTWNDYIVAVTMIGSNQSAAPSTVVIAAQTGQFGQSEHLLTAGAFLQAAVPLAVFFLLQRFFVRGILAGSVKG